MASVRSITPANQKYIIISNMPFGVKEDQLKKFFTKYGQIQSISFHYFPKSLMSDARLKCLDNNYCAIEYLKVDAADAAISQDLTLKQKRLLISRVGVEDFGILTRRSSGKDAFEEGVHGDADNYMSVQVPRRSLGSEIEISPFNLPKRSTDVSGAMLSAFNTTNNLSEFDIKVGSSGKTLNDNGKVRRSSFQDPKGADSGGDLLDTVKKLCLHIYLSYTTKQESMKVGLISYYFDYIVE
jgi:RNA recognition motif-containing protein